MKKLHFSTCIRADRATVWQKMLGDEGYRQWTVPFCEGSYFEGSWDAGARIRFLSPGGNGMVAVIAENRPHEYISIRHLGMIENGVEDTGSEKVRGWAPAHENYTLIAAGDGTEVRIDMDITPDFEQYMSDTWPKALRRLKEICEG